MTRDMLERLLKAAGTHNPVHLMDILQERGLVADEAVNVEDVPDSDAVKALVWLQRRRKA